MIGTPGRTRTADLLVRSQTLYPTELRVRVTCSDFYLLYFSIFPVKHLIDAGLYCLIVQLRIEVLK